MNTLSIIQLTASLVQLVLSQINGNKGTETASEAVKSLEAALAELQKVQGSPVTKAQLEGFKLPESF